MADNYYLLMHGVEISMNIGTSENPNYVPFGAGITNISEELNEVVADEYFLSDHGFGRSEVTGMHPQITVSGRRLVGDPAQDWIFGRKFKMGNCRKTQIILRVLNLGSCENPEQSVIKQYKADVSITSLTELSGAVENGSDISFTIAFNGKPQMIVNNPTFTVTGNNTSSVSVAIACATDGATIHYTDDGTEPTSSSATYSNTLSYTTAGTKTIKAIAVKDGMTDSDVVSTTITVTA